MTEEIRNARIDGTMLGFEDHGMMSFFLYLDYGGVGPGFGGFCLDQPNKDESGAYKGRTPTVLTGLVVQRVLEVVGVEKWEDLKGKYCRARGDWGSISAIGHILKDDWFEIEKEFAPYVAKDGEA